MTNIEKVEKLREKANVNYADAKDALERSDWDVLDAMILLEKDGKIPTEQNIVEVAYTTKDDEPNAEQSTASAGSTPGLGDLLRQFVRFAGRLIKKGNANTLIVERGSETIVGVPVTIFVLLAALAFWAIIPLLIIGLFFGFKYSFSGPDLGKDHINSAIHKANDVADGIKKEFQDKKAE
jgi:hypothetical protein